VLSSAGIGEPDRSGSGAREAAKDGQDFMATRILVVGDDPHAVPAVRDGLTARGYELLNAETGAAGLEMAARHLPDLVVAALALPDMRGTGLIVALRTFSKVPIVAVSGPDGATDIVDVLDAGADACLSAPSIWICSWRGCALGSGEPRTRKRPTIRWC
jgi:CheY-like chemotaxis protein